MPALTGPDDVPKTDANRVIAFSLLGIACILFILMGMEIGSSTEESQDSGPPWWQFGPHSVGTLDKLTPTEAEVKTDQGEQTFTITNHTMEVAFGGPMQPGQRVLVKYLSGSSGKMARVIRTLGAEPARNGAPSGSPASEAGSGSPTPSGSPASRSPATGSPATASGSPAH
ncbi:MAG TPA: hypothetical protein VGO93_13350 [Candidatus Xenobia bacterium]